MPDTRCQMPDNGLQVTGGFYAAHKFIWEYMDSDFAKNSFVHYTFQTKKHIENSIKYFNTILLPGMNVLDIGPASPMSREIEKHFNVNIFNTQGDLDSDFSFANLDYDVIIYSHVIEHQFNPLNTLLSIKKAMNKKTRFFILTPDRGKILWAAGHYHEIDSYRLNKLLNRAGYEIKSKVKQRVRRPFYQYFLGLRAFLRLFFEYNAVYEVAIMEV